MCRVPDQDDAKYKDDEDAYEDDLEEMQTKTDGIKPKDFPYTFYLMDEKQEKAYEEPIFSTYRGPIYWKVDIQKSNYFEDIRRWRKAFNAKIVV